MTFTSSMTHVLSRGAVAGVALVTAAGLAACGSDDSDSDAAASSPASGAPADGTTFVPSDALAAVQAKADEYGYDCTPTPASAEELDKVKVQCLAPSEGDADAYAKYPTLQLFDKADRDTGADVANAAVDEQMTYAEDSGITREDTAADFRTFDGDDVVGSCYEMQLGEEEATNCEDVAKVLGLDIGRLDGASTADERQQRRDEAQASEEAEASATAQAKEDARQRELQTYSGWDSFDDAKEQLDAWDISCSDDPAAEGKVAWCNLDDTSLLTYKFSVDKLEKEGVFDEVSREEMVSVSDGDWQFICAPGGEEQCQTVSEKTGKPVKDGV